MSLERGTRFQSYRAVRHRRLKSAPGHRFSPVQEGYDIAHRVRRLPYRHLQSPTICRTGSMSLAGTDIEESEPRINCTRWIASMRRLSGRILAFPRKPWGYHVDFREIKVQRASWRKLLEDFEFAPGSGQFTSTFMVRFFGFTRPSLPPFEGAVVQNTADMGCCNTASCAWQWQDSSSDFFPGFVVDRTHLARHMPSSFGSRLLNGACSEFAR